MRDADSRRSLVAAASLFALVVGVYEASPVVTSIDSRFAVDLARSLIHDGDADLAEIRGEIEPRYRYALVSVDGRLLSFFPIGAPLLAAPLIAMHDAVAGWDERKAAEKRAALLFAALAVLAIYALARRELGIAGSLALALAFAFATSLWSTASRGLWSHAPGVALVGAALVAVGARPPTRLRAASAGVALGLAWIVRPTFAVAALGVAGFLAIAHRRTLPAFAAALAVPIAAFGLWSRRVYGAWLPEYYQTPLYAPANAPGEALLGLLASPSRGLLVFSPVFLLVPLGVWLAIRRGRFGAFEGAAAGVVVAHTAVCAGFDHWWGGASYGPRLYTDVLPHLAVLLIPVVAEVEHSPGARRWILGLAFVALSAIGAAIHFRGATSKAAWLWNARPVPVHRQPERLWDWSDPQFLRGFRHRPLHEPPAPRAPSRAHRVPIAAVAQRLPAGAAWNEGHVPFLEGESVEVSGFRIRSPAKLEISLDHNDIYELDFDDGERSRCRYELGPGGFRAGLHVYRLRLDPSCSGARALRVTPRWGDRRYALGHLAIE